MKRSRTRKVPRRGATALGVMLATASMAGCAGFSRDAGFDTVAATSQAQLGKELRWPRSDAESAKVSAQVAGLLANALSVEDAVQIALLNNRGLRAGFAELQISEADLVQSGRLPNPKFDLRHSSAAGQVDIEETLSFNVLALLTIPYVHDLEKRRFAAEQSRIVLAVAQLAGDTRVAYYQAVAARQAVAYAAQVRVAADSGAQLARRMVEAGNWNHLDQAREQTFYSAAMNELASAHAAESATREHLSRLMGVSDPSAFQLAERLPELPAHVEELPDVERVVLQNRIDLQMMRLEMDALARRLRLTHATRFINVLDAGPARVRQGAADTPYERGYSITLEIPLFDSGAARTRKAEAIYAQAVDRFAQSATDARSQIRAAYARYRACFEVAARQRDEIMPLRKAVADEDLLRYNASLISVFDLLADARDQVNSVADYIHSARDYWTAKSALDAVLIEGSL